MEEYSFLNIYAPSGSQNKQARRIFFGQDIFRIIISFGNSPTIICGYSNCILSASDTERNFAEKECPALKGLIDNFNYSDAYCATYPDGDDQIVLLLALTDSMFLKIF